MRHLSLVLGFSIIVLIFIAGCTSNSVKDSDIQRTNPSLPLPTTGPHATITVSQSPIITSTITQTTIRRVAALPSRQGNNVVIMYAGGPDANLVSELQYGIETADHQWNSPKIGDKVTLSGGTSGTDHVIVVATFTDGVKQVITDSYVHWTTSSLPLPTTTVSQSPIITSTITQTRYYMVATTVQRKGNNVVVMYQGGPDASMLSDLQYGINTADHQWNSPKIGDTVTLSNVIQMKDHIIVIGTFTDGSKQLVMDTYV